MLPTKERMDKWASKRSPRFGKNRKNSRYKNDSWAALGEVKKSLRRKSALLVKKRSSWDIYGEPMLLRAGDHLMIEDKHRKSEKWEVRRSEPILVEEPTPRKPDQKIAKFPSLTWLRSMWLIRWEKTVRQTESTTFLKLRWIYWRVKEHGWGEASIPNKRGKRPDTKES